MLVRTLSALSPGAWLLLQWVGPRTRQGWGRPISTLVTLSIPFQALGMADYGYGGNSATAGYSKCVSLCLSLGGSCSLAPMA